MLSIALAALFALCILPSAAFALTDQEKSALQAQLDQINKDIAANQTVLSGLQSEHASLDRDISILNSKIKAAQLQIKQSDIKLKQLGEGIAKKNVEIGAVDSDVAKGQASLAQILRETREYDDTSLASTILSAGTVSDRFRELDDFQTIQSSLHDAFDHMTALRTDLSNKQADLEDQQTQAEQIRQGQVLAQKTIQSDQAQKQKLLSETKGQESSYQKIIANKQAQADAIRQALFGLRDTGAIQFGTAYTYAKDAQAQTNVPAALILAILTQETDLGANQGSCFVTDLSSGSGVTKSGTPRSKVMAAPRDTVPFQTITDALGLDWSNQQVSCPQSVGYGGAMGAAQFIPSTWMLYKDRLARVTGAAFPNPWNARTAVFAVALYMEDLGADGGTTSAVRNAACRYFSGRTCSGSNSVYGNSVVSHMEDIQSQIDILNSAS
jgi:membrane-bound lytic murein transglycosylase B